jgi:hypothetical protein
MYQDAPPPGLSRRCVHLPEREVEKVMTDFSTMNDEQRTRFSTLVAEVWGDAELEARYNEEPHAVLAEYGIEVEAHAAAPVIPARPDGDLSIEELDAVAAGLSVSSLACFACPVSCFSSVSN